MNPNTNLNETFHAPMIVNPLKLKNKDCTVYILNQKIYVTNYNTKRIGDKEEIWSKKEIHNFKKFGHLDENDYKFRHFL